jgi:hypothetical protein
MMGHIDRQTPPREEEDMKWGNMISIHTIQILIERSRINGVGNILCKYSWD